MVWVRYFTMQHSKYTTDDIHISTYFPDIMKQVIFDQRLDSEHYILCPLYPPSRKHPYGDFQIGVTGKLENRINSKKPLESNIEGIDRELREEIGIQPKFYSDIKPSVIRPRENWVSYILNIEDTLPTLGGRIDIKKPKGPPNRVGCIVYGDMNSIREYMNSDIRPYTDNDGIVGVVAISVKEARKRVSS